MSNQIKTRVERIREAGKFIYVPDFNDPGSIVILPVTKEDKDCFISGKDGYYFKDMCFPLEAMEELVKITTEGKRLKAALDDNMGNVYKLLNKITKGEL